MIGLGRKTYQEIKDFNLRGHLVVAGASHIGKRRHQQDALYADGRMMFPHDETRYGDGADTVAFEDAIKRPYAFAIADGMGGHSCGDVASRVCVECIAEACSGAPRYSGVDSMTAFVSNAITEADRKIVKLAAANSKYEDMGSTVVALVVCDDGCSVLNIGDSRCYLYEHRNLTLLTHDDTEAQRAVDLGLADNLDYDPVYSGDSLTRFVGQGRGGLVVCARESRFDTNDAIVLLCSDGLYKALSDDEIADVMSVDMKLTDTRDTLIKKAAESDDADNISILLVQIRRS